MKVTLKNGKAGVLNFDDKNQTARLETEGLSHLIAYVRDNQVKIKSDLYLNDSDMAAVRTGMAKYVKKVEASKKRK